MSANLHSRSSFLRCAPARALISRIRSRSRSRSRSPMMSARSERRSFERRSLKLCQPQSNSTFKEFQGGDTILLLKYRTTSFSAFSSFSATPRLVRPTYTRMIRPYYLFECFWVGKYSLSVS